MSKKRVSSVESMEDMILWIFTRLEKIQKLKWKMERGVPALTFHFVVFFILCKPVLVEGNKDQIFGESCTISSNKKQRVLNQFEC